MKAKVVQVYEKKNKRLGYVVMIDEHGENKRPIYAMDKEDVTGFFTTNRKEAEDYCNSLNKEMEK